jgi:hypothetical protein
LIVLKILCALALACTFALLGTSSSRADRGVGINVSRIAVAESLKQGGSYSLPTFAVVNTGDETAMYEVSVDHIANQVEHSPDPRWFEFRPSRFELAPGESQDVAAHLTLPAGAQTGDYYGQVQAQLVADDVGTSIGLAAATRLTFSVESSGWFAAQRLRISRFLRDLEPWTYVVEGVLLVGVAGYLIVRYSPYKLVRKR